LFLRRVHDVSAVQWSPAEANEIINLAYSKVQKEIVKVKRDAHLYWDYINTVAGTSWYPLPATFGIRRVGFKAAATDPTYGKLEPKNYEDIYEFTTGTTGTYYTRMGEWIGIFPPPSAAVVAGIELIHTPILALSDDAEVPRIKLPLHDAIALWAVLIAKGETDEEGQLAKEELVNIINDLGQWYEADTDTPDKFQVTGA